MKPQHIVIICEKFQIYKLNTKMKKNEKKNNTLIK